MKFYGTLSGAGDVHARYFYGDGSRLTNISGAAVSHASLSSLDYASSGHTGFMPTAGGTFVGDIFFGANTISGTGNIYANAFYGDGSNLTGISGAGGSSDHAILSNLDYASSGHTGFLPAASGTDIQNQLNDKSDTGHTHDNRYYTKGEINTISGALSTEIDSDISTHAGNANAHHAQSHTVVSHSDTTAIGPELNTLTDGSNADTLHTHVHTSISGADHSIMANLDYANSGHTGFLPSTSGTDIQNQLNGKLPNTSGTDIQNQLNTHVHDDRYYTETELDAGQLDNRYYTESEVNTISGALNSEIDSDISTHAGDANVHHTESHTVASHSDTSGTGAELNTLTDGSNADILHGHTISGTSISGGDHSTLANLDYASAGHTGFLPAASGTDIQEQLNGKLPNASGIDIQNQINTHIHDDRYYTETELDVGQLDNRYYTEAEVNTISGALSSEIDSDITTHASNANAHHNESHTVASHADTSGTGAELDTLTDGSNADALHTHVHTSISGADHSIMANLDYANSGHTGFLPATSGTDIQNQLNGKSNIGHLHDDRYYTESEVNTISGALSAEIDSDISTHAGNTDAHHAQVHTVISHSDTGATGAELNTLTDGSNADILHNHTISGTSISGGDHSVLSNLDYASSGHTGFLPATSGTDIQNQLNTKLENISGENHSTLANLDYASAGHTGFLPATSGTDIQNQLNTKMPLAGGTFTGNVTFASGIDICTVVSGTNDIGTSALPFQSIYADSFYGDGSNLTGIVGGAEGQTRYETVASGSWLSSGDYYYKDVVHSFGLINANNQICQVKNNDTSEVFIPYKIIGLDTNTVRIWVEDNNVNARVAIHSSGTVSGTITDHSDLANLDYASAGHTGFMPVTGGTFTGNVTMSDDCWVGLSGTGGRIVFDNQITDEINFMDCNVGIGTASPAYKLHVHQPTGGTCAIKITNDDTGIAATDGLSIGVNSSEVAYFKNYESTDMLFETGGDFVFTGGKVGIGTTSPDALLEIEGAGVVELHIDGGSNAVLNIDRGATSDKAQVVLATADSPQWYVGLADSGDLGDGSEFFIGTGSGGDGDPAIVIETNGYVGIGTESPGYILEVADNRADYMIKFTNDGNTEYRRGIIVQCGKDDGSGVIYYFRASDGDGTACGYLRDNEGTFELIQPSDERLKTKIVNTSINGLDIINGLKVRDFERKRIPGVTKTGFISQEVNEIYPGAVGLPEDEGGMLGIAEAAFIAPLVKAVQELLARVENLEKKLGVE